MQTIKGEVKSLEKRRRLKKIEDTQRQMKKTADSAAKLIAAIGSAICDDLEGYKGKVEDCGELEELPEFEDD